jgi:ribosomal protein L17
VAFGQKFAVVVSDDNYKEADRIFHGLRENVFPESLVIPSRARKLPGQCKPGSLAQKLDTADPTARSIVDHLLGDLMCVESRDEMASKEKAILPDGYMVRGAFNVRLRHYDYRPCIGERGLERQRGFLQDKYDEFKGDNDLMQPALDGLDKLLTQFDQHRLAAESLHEDLAETARLPEHEAKLRSNIAAMNRVRSSDFDEKESELSELDTRLGELQRQIENLIVSAKLDDLDRARKKQIELANSASVAKQALDKKVSEVGDRLMVSRKEELTAEVWQQFPDDGIAAEECARRRGKQETQVGIKWEQLKSFRREMADRYETMRDDPTYEVEAEDNSQYASLLERLRVNDLKAVQAKAARERINWQNLFRTTVAAKLNSALRKADDLISLMNTQLRRRIGNSEYQISKVENPDGEYQNYRQLLAACAAAGEDDLFAALEGHVRETVETLFEAIVEQPDSRIALQFLDYRNYHDYDLKVRDLTDPDGAAREYRSAGDKDERRGKPVAVFYRHPGVLPPRLQTAPDRTGRRSITVLDPDRRSILKDVG